MFGAAGMESYIVSYKTKGGAFKRFSALVAVALMVAACSASGQIPNDVNNGSFEADVNSPLYWDVNSTGLDPEISQTFGTNEHGSDPNVIVNPYDGEYFVVLRTGKDESSPRFSEISQRITVNAGRTLKGVYFFSTSDYMPYNDKAFIKLIPDSGSGLSEISLAYKDVSTVGDHGAMTGWAMFSHTFDSHDAGSYKLTLKVQDAIDGRFPSYLLVDAVDIVVAPGCYYILAGDINGDCRTDFLDLEQMASQWLNICDDLTWCNNCDIDKVYVPDIGYTVNFNDFIHLASNWLIDCNAEIIDPACTPE
jgi:hypothetical protein